MTRFVGKTTLLLVSLSLLFVRSVSTTQGQTPTLATPEATWSCATAVSLATPETGHMGMDMATPGATDVNMGMAFELDQMYIDMMIAHHASVIALANAALPRLTDARLITIAEAIVSAQSDEITELRNYREAFYGSPEPLPMDEHMMSMMMVAMPGMGSGDDMMFQMDAEAQVRAFCASANPDLTFIDQVIPHHEMAVKSSEVVATNAVHPEIRDFAKRVIDAQTAEIAELEMIRADLVG